MWSIYFCKLFFSILIVIAFAMGCNDTPTTDSVPDKTENNSSTNTDYAPKIDPDKKTEANPGRIPVPYISENSKRSRVSRNDNSCRFDDETYSATVEYSNPTTGYTATYDLDVLVENCQIVEIDFPKGGWLDEDHI